MTKISPKLIDVESNRVGTTDTYNYKNGLCHIGYGRKDKNFDPLGTTFSICKEPDGKRTTPIEMNKGGRFPTQLFTNIKNEQYKYVKNIT